MTNPMPFAKYTGRVVLAAALASAAGLVACNQDKLLTVATPDVVLPSDIAGPGALPSAYAAVIADFQVGYAGGYGGGPPALDLNEGIGQMTALLSDEFLNAETFSTRVEVDRRATDDNNQTTLQTFQDIQRARSTADLVAGRFRQFAPADPRGAEVQALAAYTLVLMGEAYCNGVPTSVVNEDGTFTYGAPQTGEQLFTTAIAKFDSAIALATATNGTKALNLARIGKGRALIDLNRYAEADAAVAAVPSNYLYVIEHSENTGRQNNAIYSYNYLERRFTVGNGEGTNGLNFVSAADPRVPTFRIASNAGVGFDEETPLFLTTKFPERKAPTPLTLGAEARLIQAEAALKAGDAAAFLANLNAARANAPTYTPTGLQTEQPLPKPAPLTAADIPASATGQQDLLFRERALTLYLTSHRLGDLRRLISQYGRNSESVFPTGPYNPGSPSKAGTVYGTDVNLPIPAEEENNPQYAVAPHCINRLAAFR
jgi:starch-binding outer membrane protein, SusD/RagB family